MYEKLFSQGKKWRRGFWKGDVGGWGGGQEAIFLIRGQEQELQMYIHVNCSQDPQKPDKMASQIHCPQEIVKITMDLRSKPPPFPGQQRREVGGGGYT